MKTASLSVPAATRPAAGPRGRTVLWGGLALLAALVAVGAFLPRWLVFLLTMAASHGLVSLGILLLMRSGVVSFGQGLVFSVGGYAGALCFNQLGITDALLLTLGKVCINWLSMCSESRLAEKI